MAVFEYKALDSAGKQKKGLLEGDSARQVRAVLRDRGLMPVSVEAAVSRDAPASSSRGQRKPWFNFQPRFAVNDLALVTRQLATLVQAAMPLEESLKAVAEQCEKPRLSSMVMAVRGKVLEGYTLANGLREYPQAFDELFCSTVAAGEKSGHLDTVLNRLADYMEQRQITRQKVVQATVYPVVLAVIAVAVVALLLAVVVPKVVAQFEHLGSTLPLSTRILIGLSDFVRDWGLLLLVAVIGAIAVWKRLLLRPAVRMAYHRWLLTLPVLGKVTRGMDTARYARTLSILVSSAVPLVEAMAIGAGVLAYLPIREATAQAVARVREGASLRAALAETKMFPPMMLHMVASGERSGELEQMLGRAADNQEREFDTLMTIAMGLLGPVVLVVMAGMVLFIVVAILQPIIALNNLVR